MAEGLLKALHGSRIFVQSAGVFSDLEIATNNAPVESFPFHDIRPDVFMVNGLRGDQLEAPDQVIGVPYGAFAGLRGGRTDQFMMRPVDVLYAIPFILVVILLMVVFGRDPLLFFLALGAIYWLDIARIVRGQTLSLREEAFIQVAKTMGAGRLHILFRHVVPNVAGPALVYATLTIPAVILAESFISFLGLGVQEPLTSWGALISDGASTMQYGTLWQIGFPLFFFVITLFAFFFIGDGLRDALDPKDR